MRKTIATTIICVFALLLFTLTACNNQDPTPTQQYTLDELLNIAHERRLAIRPPDYQWILDEFRSRERAMPFQPDSDGNRAVSLLYITTQGAIDDIMLLFHVLRSSYGPYIYFGGDDVFFPVRDSLIAEIQDAVNDNGEMRTTEFHRIVLAGLRSVINDNHFTFGGSTVGQSATFFTSDTPFDRNEQGFWHRESGQRVIEIEGHDMYRVLRVSMDERANVFYSAVIYTLEPAGLPRRTIYLVFEDGGRYGLVLQRHTPARMPHEPTRLEWVEGVAVVTVRHMGSTFAWPDLTPEQNRRMIADTQTFLSFAEELRDEPVVVLDIRGNPGGDNSPSEEFLRRLTRRMIPANHTLLQIMSPTVAFIAGFARDGPLVENNQLIILLVDTQVSSATEWLTDWLLSMENTLIIGHNTSGTFIAPGVFQDGSVLLPNSRFHLGFGSAMFIHPQNLFAEGVGFAPDIWIHGDALVAALSLIDSNFDD